MKRGRFASYKSRVLQLRKKGKSYGEIQAALKMKIPKSTLSLWCVGTVYTNTQLNRIERRMRRGGQIGRAIAMAMNRTRRNEYLQSLRALNKPLRSLIFSSKRIAKLVLVTLYLAEGSKSLRGKLMFGNSDPDMIRLFMHLMRFVYSIDNRKFRCTVQCRADQDIPSLERFWSAITKVPLTQFYKARVDPRSIGVVTLKKDYKAVCRIDYFSAHIYNDLRSAGSIVLVSTKGP